MAARLEFVGGPYDGEPVEHAAVCPAEIQIPLPEPCRMVPGFNAARPSQRIGRYVLGKVRGERAMIWKGEVPNG